MQTSFRNNPFTSDYFSYTAGNMLKLNDPTVMSAFQATIDGRFAPLATLADEDADLNFMVTHFNKAVTDTAAELLVKQHHKRKP